MLLQGLCPAASGAWALLATPLALAWARGPGCWVSQAALLRQLLEAGCLMAAPAKGYGLEK